MLYPFNYQGVLFGCKDSAKFRFSEENTNKFAFLSVRNLSKSSEKPNFIWIFPRCSLSLTYFIAAALEFRDFFTNFAAEIPKSSVGVLWQSQRLYNENQNDK